MRTFSPTKYPNLARLDQLRTEFIKSPRWKELSRDEREQEMCRIHPIYWMEEHSSILRGSLEGEEVLEAEIIPFQLNSTQLLIADRVCANLIGSWKRTKINVLKCRKVGVSTLFAGFDYWFMRFLGNIYVFVIADKSKHTDNIFEMIVRFHKYDTCPGKPGTVPMRGSKYGLKLANGALVECDTGETKNPGTSQDCQIAHMSENAKWAQLDDAEQSLLNSIPRTGFAWMVRESTAKGINKFEEDCRLAEEGKSDWQFIFIPWYDAEDCIAPLDPGEEIVPTPEEAELISLYSLTEEQIKFRRQRIKDIGADKFKEDFPATSKEAFLITASSYFWIDKIQDRIEEIDFHRMFREKGLNAALRSGKFPTIKLRWDQLSGNEKYRSNFIRSISDRTIMPRKVQISEVMGKVTYKTNEALKEGEGFVWMWRHPDRQKKYLVSVDPAEGLSSDGYTSDLSVVEVFDCYKREQVAEFAGIYDEEVTARYAVLLALLYNNAMVVVEVNNKCGGVVLENIKKFGYHHFYYSQKLSRGQVVSTHPGWKTTRGNKKEVCYQLKNDFKNNACLLHSRDLLIEMLHVVEEKGKLRASKGNTDDRMMACSIALTVIDKTPGLRSMSPEDAIWEVEKGILPFGKQYLTATPETAAPVAGHRKIELNRYGKQNVA